MSNNPQWSQVELDRAIELNAKGESNAYIGWDLARSEAAVRVKLSRQRHPRRPRGRMWATIATEHLVAELERRGYTCTPPEQLPARIDL